LEAAAHQGFSFDFDFDFDFPAPQGGSGAQPQDFVFLTPDFLFCHSILIIRTLYPSGKRIKTKTLGLRP